MKKEQILTDDEIRSRLRELPGWSYDGTDIRREYETDGWSITLMLVNALGFAAESANHHPDLAVGWSKVGVRLHTHSAGGITDKDFAVARRFEQTAMWRPPEESGLPKLSKPLVRSPGES